VSDHVGPNEVYLKQIRRHPDPRNGPVDIGPVVNKARGRVVALRGQNLTPFPAFVMLKLKTGEEFKLDLPPRTPHRRLGIPNRLQPEATLLRQGDLDDKGELIREDRWVFPKKGLYIYREMKHIPSAGG